MRRSALTLAAALAGASGLALETLLVDCAGLGLGHGRSTALGLATFIAAWALGANRAGKSRRSPQRDLFWAGARVALVAAPAVSLVLAGGRAPGSVASVLTTVLAIAVAGFCQGAFLAPLARAFSGEIAWLLAANLGGSVAGALWLADRIVGDYGRLPAALAAAAVGLAAGGIGGAASAGIAPATHRDLRTGFSSRASAGEISWRSAAWIVASCTAWLASLEWVGLRLGVLWLGGMQPALRAILAASMISLALGAALVPYIAPRGGRGVLWTLILCSVAAMWPLFAGATIRLLDLARLAPISRDLATALLLVLPALAPFGGLLAVLHRALPLESGERLGRLLLHEASGALLGLPLVHLVLVRAVGLGGSVALLEVCGLVSILSLARARPRAAATAAVLPLVCGSVAWLRPPPALESPPLSNPAFHVLSFAEDRDFAVTVVDDGIQGERTLLTDGFRAAGTGPEYRYMQVLGHLPVLLSPHPRRVAVLALGTGTTVGAVALHDEVERIDVLELSRAVVEAAPWFREKNRGALAEGLPGLLDAGDGNDRVVVHLGDGRATLAAARGAFDVITMEPLLPDSPFGVYLYTREFYERAREALAPEGLLCQWVPPHALEPASFTAVLDAFARAFPWSSVWLSGTQVILLGGEREPRLDPGRFSSKGDLARALAELGLSTPAGLLSRFVGDGARVRTDTRELRDCDPWIVYRPRRAGPILLADLPQNLAWLRTISTSPSQAWLSSAGPEAAQAIEGMTSLRWARESYSFAEARLRGLRGSTEEFGRHPDLDGSLERARALVPGDPEVADLEEEIAFNSDLRAGVSSLGSDGSREGARAALPFLRSAARSRPRRGDVHLYLRVALERFGDPTQNSEAEIELRFALEACPRIARTPEGKRSRALGLSDAAWSKLEDAAAAAEREFFTNKPFGKSSGLVTTDSP